MAWKLFPFSRNFNLIATIINFFLFISHFLCWLNKLPSVKMKLLFSFAIIVIAVTVVYGAATDPWNEYKVIFTIGPFHWPSLYPISPFHHKTKEHQSISKSNRISICHLARTNTAKSTAHLMMPSARNSSSPRMTSSTNTTARKMWPISSDTTNSPTW